MGMKSFTLGAIACARTVLALAAPGIVPIFPIRNETKPAPTPGPTDLSCLLQCSVEYPSLTAVQWIPKSQIVYTTRITVATYRHVIVTAPNSNHTISTRGDLIFGYVPSEYDLYRVTLDGEGTAVVNVPLTLSDGISFSQMTYPTPYIDYTSEYHWQGVLPTFDEKLNPACETIGPKYTSVTLPLHPEYPQPKDLGPGKADRFGVDHRPVWGPVKAEPDASFFQAAFPSEAAFVSCESASAQAAMPTEYEAPEFLTGTETVWSAASTAGWVHLESTATGFEEQTSVPAVTFEVPRPESTASSFNEPPVTKPLIPTDGATSPKPHLESTGTGFGERSDAPVSTPFHPGPVTRPPAVLPTPTPIFTFMPTTVDGQTTSIPIFLIPGPSGTATTTATIGQTIIFNGQPTVLAPPPPIFTLVPTIVDGQKTTVPVFLIPNPSGTTFSTASIGQTVTINGRPTVLAPPPPVFTFVPTTIDGVLTTIPVYIIEGTFTATLGQTVTINNVPTVIAPPSIFYTTISTDVNGHPTSIPVYIISGTLTATIGQTVTINNAPTVITPPPIVYTTISTDVNGHPTSIPVYIISGTLTATIGQTVTLNEVTTVLQASGAVFTMLATTISGTLTMVPAYVINGVTVTRGQTVTIEGSTTVVDFAVPTETGDGREGATSVAESAVPTETGGGKGGDTSEVGASATVTGTPGEGAGSRGWTLSWSAALMGVIAVVFVCL